MGEAKRRKKILKEEYGRVNTSVINSFTVIPPEKFDSKYDGDNEILIKMFNEDNDIDKPEGMDIDGRVLIPLKLLTNEKEYDILFGLEINDLKRNMPKNIVVEGILYCGFNLSVLGSNKKSQLQKAKEIKIQVFYSLIQLITGDIDKAMDDIIDSSQIRIPNIRAFGSKLVVF